jgi:hypothetical protein
MKKAISCILSIMIFCLPILGRSPFRKKDPRKPEITIGWKNSKRVLKRSHWVYTEYPLFTTFNAQFFNEHHLPRDVIPSRANDGTTIDCSDLDRDINGVVAEIKKRKKKYTQFTVIQDKNFNYNQQCGLLVLKFNKYPLVLKLFMETPKTFIDPYCKGFENQFFFYMSGGINRHIAGLTRIKNLELIREQITEHPRWAENIITPRKWYWLPQKPQYIEITGKNINDKKEIKTYIPGTYAIIADELDTKEDSINLSSQEKSELIMQLCMDLHLFVDPHSDNFIIKHKENSIDYTISIVDTEHFPSMVGLKEEPFFNNHIEWYIYLAAKFLQDAYMQTKYSRRQAQKKFNPCAIQW